jgi:mRNA-degrading endonuclease RelE of RelBE toxin-antitoxin system
MSYKIITIPSFNRDLKSLSKKHRSIPKDYEHFLDDLELNPKMGVEILENCFKIRMAIASKGKGKSGGARVITYVYIQDQTVYLLSIYDKSDEETISDKEIRDLIKSLGLV